MARYPRRRSRRPFPCRRPRSLKTSVSAAKPTTSGSTALRKACMRWCGNPPCTWTAGSVRRSRPRHTRALPEASRRHCCGISSTASNPNCAFTLSCRCRSSTSVSTRSSAKSIATSSSPSARRSPVPFAANTASSAKNRRSPASSIARRRARAAVSMRARAFACACRSIRT